MSDENADELKEVVEWAAITKQLAIDTITSFHKKHEGEGVYIFPAFFLTRAIAALDSTALLTQAGYAADALSVMRTISELNIDFAYITKEDTENRLRLFENYRFVVAKRRVDAFGAAGWSISPELLSRVNAEFERVAENYRPLSRWCRHSIADRATQGGKQASYSIFYTLGSGASHAGAESLLYVNTREFTEEGIVWKSHLGPRDPVPFVLFAAVLEILGLIGQVLLFQNMLGFEDRYAAMFMEHSPRRFRDEMERRIAEAGGLEAAIQEFFAP